MSRFENFNHLFEFFLRFQSNEALSTDIFKTIDATPWTLKVLKKLGDDHNDRIRGFSEGAACIHWGAKNTGVDWPGEWAYISVVNDLHSWKIDCEGRIGFEGLEEAICLFSQIFTRFSLKPTRWEIYIGGDGYGAKSDSDLTSFGAILQLLVAESIKLEGSLLQNWNHALMSFEIRFDEGKALLYGL